MANKILFLDTTHPILYEKLQDYGFEIHFDFESSEEKLIPKISEYKGIIIRSRIKITSNLMKHATHLKFIGRVGSGLENIDIEFANQNGIQCINSPEGNRDAVAEHTIGMLLCLNNKILKSDREVRDGKWLREENRGTEIAQKTIGIIGFGNMGSAFAQRLQGFDCEILAFDKYKKSYAPSYVQEVSLSYLFDKADIVSFHIPYNAETHYLINRNFLRKFRKNITIINTSRGKIANTDDIVHGLKTNKITGACLDVLEYESTNLQNLPKEDWYPSMIELSKMDNVVLNSHIAGWTHESNIKLSLVLVEKIKSLNIN